MKPKTTKPTKYAISRSGFVQLAEPIKRYLIKSGMPDEMRAAMFAGNLVSEITPVIEGMVEQAIAKEATDDRA